MATTGQFLAGGGATEQTNFLPGWYEDYLQRVSAGALGQASQAYTPYGGQRLASTSAPTLAARERLMGRAANPVYAGALQQAQGALTNAAAPVTGADLSRYTDPYQSQVIDEMTRRATQNFEESVLPGVYSGFTGAGQSGSAREMEYANRARRDFSRDLSGAVTGALSSGFGRASELAASEKSRMIGAGGALGQFAGTQARLDDATTASLLGVGADIEGREQQELGLGVQDFERQRMYNWEQLDRLNSILRGMQLPQSAAGYAAAPRLPPSSTLSLLGGSFGLARDIGQLAGG